MNKAFLHAVIIYTITTCPFCHNAKELLDKKHVKYEEIVVNKMDEKEQDETREMLFKRTGQKTVPQIFINDKSIGGFSDLKALDESGKLDELLAADKENK
ncbi:MAG: glutaredoxin 3 [Candidatus Rickettsia vulgarisii]